MKTEVAFLNDVWNAPGLCAQGMCRRKSLQACLCSTKRAGYSNNNVIMYNNVIPPKEENSTNLNMKYEVCE